MKVRGRLGPGEEDMKAIRILNRIIEWTREGLWYEADQRHAEIIVKEMGLEEGKVKSEVPGDKLPVQEEDDDALPDGQTKAHQALTARANYLAQDRSDIQFSVKELARDMSKPTKGSWKKLIKLGKYLKTHDRSGYLYQYQALPEGLAVWTDTDYAGCKRTRKSTSGGSVM